ncbi:class C sortase [Cutibacterium sp. WCA-380-WT-3A]|uniref:Class C sortase n=2 Tax=Cutibacterium porci TaxID=2605781 RepID=A0A7K0J4B6_9ACTN|nr:class C sortase [Cutibacterium porci]
MAVLLAPVVVTQIKNTEQARIAENYSKHVAQLDGSTRATQIRRAHEYNQKLQNGTIRDPWGEPPDTESARYRDYLSQLNLDQAMARVRVPSVGIDLPVYHGTSQRVLAAGVGHLYGTALPVGGAGTHSVLTGHTGLATLTMFDNLTHVRVGDIFYVDVMGETLAYKVDQIRVVEPTDLAAVRPVSGRDYATLVTCTPYGINSHRLLVRGVRTTPVPPEPAQRYHSPWQPWMIAVMIVVLLILIYLIYWLVSGRRRSKDDQTNALPRRSAGDIGAAELSETTGKGCDDVRKA